jgi:hypothetical protein
MQTRRQNPDTHRFRQDAFASSIEYDQGLLANLVSARCEKLADRTEIAMHWWLQQVSWREGSLEKFATDFLETNRSGISTPAMRVFGMKAGQIYDAKQVRTVRAEMRGKGRRFRLRGEPASEGIESYLDQSPTQLLEQAAKSRAYPLTYAASEMAAACIPSADEFACTIREALVNPAAKSLRDGLWYFVDLWSALHAWRQKEIDEASSQMFETEVSKKTFAALDYAHESKSFVLIEGREGIGKSMSVRSWCARHPGEVVYISLSSGHDETSLLRSIARVVGTACALTMKMGEMKARVEAALLPGQLTVVLDEAHFLWPQTERGHRSAPKRLDWVRTALVDHGVPVVLVSTPQYFGRQCERFREGGWNSNQVQRRLALTVTLPEALPLSDTLAIVAHYFPESSTKEVRQVAILAMLTVGYLTTIAFLRKRVDFFATRQRKASPRELLALAIVEVCDQHGIKPDALKGSDTGALHQADNALALPLQGTGREAALPVPLRHTSPATVSRIHNQEVELGKV